MDDRRWEKLAAATGIAFIVLILVSSFIVPEQIRIDDPLSKIVAHFGKHRSGLLVGGYLSGLATVFGLWFLGTVAAYLRRNGAPRLAAIALVSAGVAIAVGLIGGIAGGELAYRGGALSGGLVRVLYDMSLASFVIIWFPVATVIASVSMAGMRTASLPKWVWQSGAVLAVLLLVAGSTWASHGAWAPGGVFNFIAFLLFALWTLGLSVALWQRVGMPADAQAMQAERPLAMTS